jgi:dipeptidyl aminopeptidase/acylaminoacyl peptidase
MRRRVGQDCLYRAAFASFCLHALCGQVQPTKTGAEFSKRPLRVEDAIGMTRLAAPDQKVALFSPDRNRFLVLIKKGNLERNTNDFSLLLYQTEEVLHSPAKYVLVKMSSSSNRDAIKEPKWLDNNRTIVFLGENPGEVAQLYSADVRTRRIIRLTNSPYAINHYDISGDGREIVYTTDPRKEGSSRGKEGPGFVTVPEGRWLSEFLAGDCPAASDSPKGQQLYVQHNREAAIVVPLPDDYLPNWTKLMWMSPDGRYSVVGVLVREIPASWADYQDERLQQLERLHRAPGLPVRFLERYLLLDTQRHVTRPLLNTPMTMFAPVIWSRDSQCVFLKGVFLPLDAADPVERQKREKQRYNVGINVISGEAKEMAGTDWPKEEIGPSLRVFIKEDRNTPPKIYVDDGNGSPRLLLNLNPWLDSIDLAGVEVVEWVGTDGHRSKGELYLPPHHAQGRRYPLVIQTHGFAPGVFLLEGPYDSSAFAAQSLAANGFAVLQMDYDRSAAYKQGEGAREMASYEGAIDDLDRRGVIERKSVGIIGFSRTVYQVEYSLTHSKYRFAAASLVDGMDAGYLQYLAFGVGDNVELNGGQPFGDGLQSWLKNSPSFQLGHVRTPVRLEAHGCSGGILSSWEWFIMLSEMEKPVELTYFPGAPHIVAKPRERLESEEDMLDWFCFWLKGEMEHSKEKTDRTKRWNELRKKQEADDRPE